MSIEIVLQGDTIKAVSLVPPEVHTEKVECNDCRRMVFRQAAHRTEDGWRCARCLEH